MWPADRALIVGALCASFAFVVSGCAGGSGEPAGGSDGTGPADPTFSQGTGAIAGQVTDDEGLPVAAAQVAVTELELLTTSDASGRFVFSDVAPGAYTLAVQSLGYESKATRVTVEAGATVETAFVLSAIRLEEPWVQVMQQAGHIDWGARIESPVESRGYAGGDLVHEWELEDRTDRLRAMYVEMTWEDTQALAGGMRLRVEVEGEANNLDYTFCVIDSTSPGVCHVTDNITMILENGHDDCNEEECAIQYRAFTATKNTNLDVDFGVMLDQDFTVWASHFFNQDMPQGYAARPDA
jgi:hypothetical protein